MVEKVYYRYDQLHDLCKNSSNQLINDFNPDVILAIGGGGLIPARMLRSKLKIPIYVVSSSAYDDEDNSLNEPKIVQWMDFESIRNKRILIVDEVDDTRKTLKYLVNKLVNEEQINRENLGIFVLHNKLKTKEIGLTDLDIGYYNSGENVEDLWIVYPWEN